MSISDTIGYLTIGNPISQAVISSASAIIKSTGLKPKKLEKPIDLPIKPMKLSEVAGRHYNFIRVAGISGALAVFMGAYGKQHFNSIEDLKDKTEAKAVFDTANRYHLLHSLALMAVPLAKKPLLTGALMTTGTLLFSGTMYYRALTGDKSYTNVATCGGFVLIAAWLTLIL